jgi:hypothetical protein
MEKLRYQVSRFDCAPNVHIVHDIFLKKIIVKGEMSLINARCFAMMLNNLDLIHDWVTPGSGKWHEHTTPETLALISQNIDRTVFLHRNRRGLNLCGYNAAA